MKFQQLASIPFVMGIMIQAGGAYDLQISTNRFDVLFECPPIPEALQTFIVADIQRCYDAWGTNVTIEPGFPGRYGPYITRNVFGGPYSDETIDFPRLLTTNALGQLALKIPPSLVQKYAEASALFLLFTRRSRPHKPVRVAVDHCKRTDSFLLLSCHACHARHLA